MTAVAILAQGKSRHNESFFSKTYRGSEDGRQAPTRQPANLRPLFLPKETSAVTKSSQRRLESRLDL